MKKSLLLLMFALATVGFDACGMELASHLGDEEKVEETICEKACELLASRPVIIVTISAATAGTAYGVTKFINKQWNKNYNAKKAAAIIGSGAGLIAGAYLFWPASNIDSID